MRVAFFTRSKEKRRQKRGREGGEGIIKFPASGISQFHGKTSRRLWNDDDRNKKRKEKRKKLFLHGKPLEGLDRLSSAVATGVDKSIR